MKGLLIRTGEYLIPFGKYNPENVIIQLGNAEDIDLYIGSETNNISISLPKIGIYILSKHESIEKARERAGEFDKKLKQRCLIKIIDRENAKISD